MTDDQITQAAQLIAQGDFMEAMKIFENFIESNPDDPAGYHGWAEAALFEIQVNGNFDEKGNDRINEGQVMRILQTSFIDGSRKPRIFGIPRQGVTRIRQNIDVCA